MSLYDYQVSKEIAQQDYPFYALIMAAARRADTTNLQILRAMWPEMVSELEERYNAPGGYLPSEIAQMVESQTGKAQEAGPRDVVKFPDVTVKLVGEDGNALVIIGKVTRALRRAGYGDEVDAYRYEALSGDYDNLLHVTMQWVNVE